ncbi:MAG TPA: aminotransferase class V-fold PLP-dependent enzyme [Phycisphaerales bacterium]
MQDPAKPAPSPLASHWSLDPAIVYLNHGSFGATPTRVLEAQTTVRARMESEAVRFFVEELQEKMDECRRAVAGFVDCDWDELAMLTNATVGVATALENIPLHPGDEILVNDHEYPACLNNARRIAARVGARVVTVTLPWPLPEGCSSDEAASLIARTILDGVTPRTRIALLSHVSSPSGLLLPIERIIPTLRERGIRTIIDGAHAPGMVPTLSLRTLGCDYYTANCHKWICSPKGSAFLYVRRELHATTRPLVLSNNAESPKTGRPQFLTEFDFLGTADVSSILAIPEAIRTMESIGASLPAAAPPEDSSTHAVAPHLARFYPGFVALMRHNHSLALRGRRLVVDAMKIPAVAPEAMIGTIASIFIPRSGPNAAPSSRPLHRRYADALQERLIDRWGIQVPVWWVPGTPQRLVRISAQAYNTPEQYAYLRHALETEIAAER